MNKPNKVKVSNPPLLKSDQDHFVNANKKIEEFREKFGKIVILSSKDEWWNGDTETQERDSYLFVYSKEERRRRMKRFLYQFLWIHWRLTGYRELTNLIRSHAGFGGALTPRGIEMAEKLARHEAHLLRVLDGIEK